MSSQAPRIQRQSQRVAQRTPHASRVNPAAPAVWVIAAMLVLPGAAVVAASCVSNFDTFISRFEKDPGFQRQNTLYPLDYSFLDQASQPTPKTVKLALGRTAATARGDLDFPTIEQQQAIPLVRAQKCGQPNACVIAFDRPDADTHSTRFSFALRRGCWRLIGIANISL